MSINAEQAVLGTILIEPGCFDEVGLDRQDFLVEKHRDIYGIMEDLHKERKPIDVVTLTEKLASKQLLERIGNVSYLIELQNTVVTISNLEHYVDIVKQASTKRTLLAVAEEIGTAIENGEEIQEVLDLAERKIMSIETVKKAGLVAIGSFIAQHFNKIAGTDPTKAVDRSWGYQKVDRLTSGLTGNQSVIVAARPSVGKTAFTLNLATNIASQNKGPLALFSLEMSKEQLMNRILSAISNVPLQKIKVNRLSEGDWTKLSNAAAMLQDLPLFIFDESNVSLRDIASECRKLKRKFGSLSAVCIDYLQLIDVKERPGENRSTAIGRVSKGIKMLSKELDCPFITLSQLSRDVEKRKGDRPKLSDLRESGDIEQDADIVVFLYRDDEKETTIYGEPVSFVEVIVAKDRDGMIGTVPFKFRRAVQRYIEVKDDPNATSN